MTTTMLRTALAAIACVLSAVACGPAAEGEEERDPTLSAIKSDIFEPRCSATVCHGGGSPAANLDLITEPHAALVDVDSDSEVGEKRVVAGDPEASLLYRVLNDAVGNVERMPQGGEKLADIDIEQIKAWIDDGAKDN